MVLAKEASLRNNSILLGLKNQRGLIDLYLMSSVFILLMFIMSFRFVIFGKALCHCIMVYRYTAHILHNSNIASTSDPCRNPRSKQYFFLYSKAVVTFSHESKLYF